MDGQAATPGRAAVSGVFGGQIPGEGKGGDTVRDVMTVLCYLKPNHETAASALCVSRSALGQLLKGERNEVLVGCLTLAENGSLDTDCMDT